ncbi:aspartate aminotransferase [compost metagenome]
MSFCETLLDQVGVAATPGIDFDRAGGNRYVRFSYAGRRQTIEQALERMATFLK